MNFIEWDKSHETGVSEIDNQHKLFVKNVNELYGLLGSDQITTVNYLMGIILKNLKIHFNTEETMMREHHFVDFYSHKLEHDRYYNKIKGFKETIENGESRLNLEMLRSLKRWFRNHLEINDKKCGKYLYDLGIR